jgi:hypothetical protein
MQIRKRGDGIKKNLLLLLKSSSLCLYSSNLGTFWLKIEQFWPFEEIYIFSNGGHLGPYGKFPYKSSCLKPFAQ